MLDCTDSLAWRRELCLYTYEVECEHFLSAGPATTASASNAKRFDSPWPGEKKTLMFLLSLNTFVVSIVAEGARQGARKKTSRRSGKISGADW